MPSDSYLNKEQIEAISYGEGPLLIVAGAGTGKTTVITERIKHLITKKGISPEEILALTFTEKAANEMQERIDKIMPYGYNQMWISTFHSFCDALLRQEALHIGLTPGYRLMTETDSVLFLRKNIFKLNLSYFRPLGNPTKFLEALLTHFARLNDEDITADEYLSFAQSLEKDLTLSTTPEEKKEEILKILELAETFKTYEELKIKEGVMDFSNLITQTLFLLRKRKSLLKKYQDQFNYILVDEFQDTNYAQNELAILLSGNKKNITIVADDDQAIYRWRGAALSNVIQFKNNFPDAKMITLTKNYRSTQEILDHSYQVIQYNNPNRLEAIEHISKKLTSERKVKGEKIEFIHTQRVDEEAEAIGKRILQFRKKEKYEFSDMAILVRANNHAQPIAAALQRMRIPYQFLGPGQLFQQEEIKNLTAYLKVLYNLEDSVSLYRVLSMDVFELSARDVSYLLTSAKKRNLTLFETLEKIEQTYINPKTKDKVIKIVKMILRHLERIKKDTAGQILYYFLLDTGLYSTYTEVTSTKSEQETQNIAKFFDKIKTFETLSKDATVYAVVDWIDLMMEMGDSPLVSEIDWKDFNAVNILTVHSSKGLEFPVVFMPHLVADRFPTRERREKIPIAQNLIKEIIPEGDYHAQEERRLFYVGMTRAMNHLIFTASSFYAEGKREKKISQFVTEAVPELVEEDERKKKVPAQLSLIELTRDYEEKKGDSEGTKITWISYSQLQSFDLCPLHYKARYILNIPTPASSPLSFGITLHNTFSDLYDALKNRREPTYNDFLTLLKKNWISEGYQDKQHAQLSYEKAEDILQNYYQNHYNTQNIPLALEMPFSFNINSEIRVTGKIDRIDKIKDNGIEIIDYKTGAAELVLKSTYKFQLGLYALAATKLSNPAIRRLSNDITVTLFYLDNCEKISMKISPKDLEATEKKIMAKVQEIEKSNFECSRSIFCNNCEYKMLCNASV